MFDASIHNLPCLLGFGLPGGYEWIILLVLALLIFGRRLPEVGRSVGKAIVEFKRGIKGIEDEIEDESSRPESQQEPKKDKPASIAHEPPQELPKPTAPAEPVVSQEDVSENDGEAAEVDATSSGRDERSSG